MTYDEAVNDLVRRYRDGAFPDWTMTDDDSAQRTIEVEEEAENP